MKYSENPIQHEVVTNLLLLNNNRENNKPGGLMHADSNSDLANYIVALEIAHKKLLKMLQGWFNDDDVAVATILTDARNNWEKPKTTWVLVVQYWDGQPGNPLLNIPAPFYNMGYTNTSNEVPIHEIVLSLRKHLDEEHEGWDSPQELYYSIFQDGDEMTQVEDLLTALIDGDSLIKADEYKASEFMEDYKRLVNFLSSLTKIIIEP